MLGGFDMFTEMQWFDHVKNVLSPFRIAEQSTATVFEDGVGCGAFLNAWQHWHPRARLSGLDYSPVSVEVAKSRLNGTFAVGRAENISSTPAFASATYRYVVAHGVTLYLSSLNAMSQMLASMLAHSTHYVGVFDVNLAFKGKALAMRSKTHTAEAQKRRNTLPTPQQLFVPKQLVRAQHTRAWSMCRGSRISVVSRIVCALLSAQSERRPCCNERHTHFCVFAPTSSSMHARNLT